MKVLVFTSLYPNNIWPHRGVFIRERICHFVKIPGCTVKVVAPVPYFPPLKIGYRWWFSQVVPQEIRDGIEVYHPRYFMIPKLGMALYGFLMFLSVLPTIKKIQRDFEFDLIDAHFVYPDGFASTLLGKILRKPVVVSARGSDVNLYKEFPLIRKILQQTLNRADKVIAVSQALKETMVGMAICEEKISVIPNGVDQNKFFPFPKEEARRRLGIPNKRMLLSVGHLAPVKGFDLLIQAFKALIDELGETNLSLVIVGEGAFRKELERLISHLNLNVSVCLVGEVPHRDLYLWYNAADLFCLASSREGWPNVLMESLACGTPVVAVPVGGIPEIICSDCVGILTARNAQAIAKGLSFALKKSWQAETIVQYTKGHTWDRVACAIFQVFKSVLEGKRLA